MESTCWGLHRDATVMLVVYAIVKASTDGWLSERTLGAGLVAVAMVALFIWVERHVRRPIVPLGIFRSRNITGATIVRALFPIGLFGQFFIGALYLQHVLGYGPLETGLAFMPMNLMVTVFSLVISARLMTRVGAKLTILPGLVLILGGLILLSRVPVNGSYLLDVFPGMALFGAGAGLAFAPSVALAMADAAPEDVGLASGLANVSLQLGAAIGVAVLASISSSRTNDLLARHVSRSAALVGGYHLGYLVAAGCIVAAIGLGALIFNDVGVGRAPALVRKGHAPIGPRLDQEAAPAAFEAEVGL